MDLQEWDVLNADGDVIDCITTGSPRSIETAAAKLAVRYGTLATFLRLEYHGKRTI